MAITNVFDVEALIIAKLGELFAADMIFDESESNVVDNEFFTDKGAGDGAVGVIVINSGFKADPLVAARSNPKQTMKMMWQIAIVCPKSIRKTHGGIKAMSAVQLLKGWRVAKDIGIMSLVDDERGFNRPHYANDLVYLPSMFAVDAVI